MSRLAKKIFGAVAAFVMAVLEALYLFAGLVGLTTVPEDVDQKAPVLIFWLIDTPWWVAAFVIPGLMVAAMLWAFWPDRAVQIAMREYKASNDRAWQFQPEFRDGLARLDREANLAIERQAHFDALHVSMSEEIARLRGDLVTMQSAISSEVLAALRSDVALQLDEATARHSLLLTQKVIDEFRPEMSRFLEEGRFSLLCLEKLYKDAAGAPSEPM